MGRYSEEMTKWEAATAQYLHNLENTGASLKTVKHYGSIIENFTRHMFENGYTRSGPVFTAVQSWRDELIKSCNLKTVAHYLQILSGFFKYAVDPTVGLYENNPVTHALYPNLRKLNKRPYDKLLNDQQVMELWINRPKTGKMQQTWPRNYAIVVLLLSTQIRNSELLSLTPADLDFENAELVVEHGKGDKFRVVDFPPIAQSAVKLYLASGLRPNDLPETAPLFGTTAAKQWGVFENDGVWKRGSAEWLSNLVERHVFNITGVHKIRTHDLRHVGARLELNNGMSIEELQSKLGHVSIATTQLYSGRLEARSSRRKSKKVYAERDLQAARNLETLMHAAS